MGTAEMACPTQSRSRSSATRRFPPAPAAPRRPAGPARPGRPRDRRPWRRVRASSRRRSSARAPTASALPFRRCAAAARAGRSPAAIAVSMSRPDSEADRPNLRRRSRRAASSSLQPGVEHRRVDRRRRRRRRRAASAAGWRAAGPGSPAWRGSRPCRPRGSARPRPPWHWPSPPTIGVRGRSVGAPRGGGSRPSSRSRPSAACGRRQRRWRSGRACQACRPSRPSAAESAATPSAWSWRTSTSRLIGWSSTTSTLLPSAMGRRARQRRRQLDDRQVDQRQIGGRGHQVEGHGEGRAGAGALSTVTSPPISSARRRTIDRPRPVPP